MILRACEIFYFVCDNLIIILRIFTYYHIFTNKNKKKTKTRLRFVSPIKHYAINILLLIYVALNFYKIHKNLQLTNDSGSNEEGIDI